MKDTTENIIKAAQKVFAQKGYEGATIREIAAKAGVNVSAINYHFKSKLDLYKEIIRSITQTKISWFIDSVQPHEPITSVNELRSRIKLFANVLIQSMHEEPEINQIIEQEIQNNLPYAKEEFLAFMPKLTKTFTSIIEEGQKSGIVRSDIKIKYISHSFLPGIMNSFKHKHIIKNIFNIDIDNPKINTELFDQHINIFIRGILSEKEK